MKFAVRCSFLLVGLLIPMLAVAHDARPNYVQITETAPNTFSANWKVPASVPGGALPYPTLPEDCVAEREPAWQQAGAEYVGQQVFKCTSSLSGRAVGIEFPIINPSLSTLYKVKLANGEEHLQILKPDESEWVVPEAESRFGVAREYTLLGIEHIWIGIDHLLFVACLLFIARTPRRLLVTITGFTVAHSITLALSALDLVRIPTPPVEAAIALSVVFLAWEIVKGDESALAYRYPVVVSSSFGLLHGFGFAAVLRDIGLPQTELPTALLFFNVGVEIGQILFVLVLLGGFFLLRPLLVRVLRAPGDGKSHWEWVTVPASYVIGSIATYWMIDRVSGFWV
jgi:hydrogenase/urease accessory protein HupE